VGTLLGAAATLVIVALVSESLRRPAQKVTAVRSLLPGANAPWQHEEGSGRVQANSPVTARRSSFSNVGRERRAERAARDRPNATAGSLGRVHIYSSRPRWRLALVTGLVAFAIVIAFYTVSDAVKGRSITGNGQRTTFFGGSSSQSSSSGSTTTTGPGVANHDRHRHRTDDSTSTATQPIQTTTSARTSTSPETSTTSAAGRTSPGVNSTPTNSTPVR
jgi:hypothetical protein